MSTSAAPQKLMSSRRKLRIARNRGRDLLRAGSGLLAESVKSSQDRA
ncbi:hypothetical protein [Streptomyces rectiverticillatus]|nr:hypothetical protein [Streptomyces rectiverticillatus]